MPENHEIHDTEMTMKIIVFVDMTPRILIEICQWFRGTIVAVRAPEFLVNFYQATRNHIPENGNINHTIQSTGQG